MIFLKGLVYLRMNHSTVKVISRLDCQNFIYSTYSINGSVFGQKGVIEERQETHG